MSLYSFTKHERLSGKQNIDQLFSEGSSFFIHPIKVYWKSTIYVSGSHAQVMIIVGKKVFKRAVDRNRIRRQIKEVCRLNKNDLHQFLEEHDLQCQFALMYVAPSRYEFTDLEMKIKSVLKRLMNEISNKLNIIDRSLSDN